MDGAALIRHDLVMSVHDLGAGELLGALHVLEAWPRRVRVIGLEPKLIELGLELTEPVAAGMPGLIGAVGAYLAAWQREDAEGLVAAGAQEAGSARLVRE
jgi:hydrogenase maturation protease